MSKKELPGCDCVGFCGDDPHLHTNPPKVQECHTRKACRLRENSERHLRSIIKGADKALVQRVASGNMSYEDRQLAANIVDLAIFTHK